MHCECFSNDSRISPFDQRACKHCVSRKSERRIQRGMSQEGTLQCACPIADVLQQPAHAVPGQGAHLFATGHSATTVPTYCFVAIVWGWSPLSAFYFRGLRLLFGADFPFQGERPKRPHRVFFAIKLPNGGIDAESARKGWDMPSLQDYFPPGGCSTRNGLNQQRNLGHTAHPRGPCSSTQWARTPPVPEDQETLRPYARKSRRCPVRK